MSASTDSLAGARLAVQDLCHVDTSEMKSDQLLAVLDDTIAQARRNGDRLAANVLVTVRRTLGAKANQLH